MPDVDSEEFTLKLIKPAYIKVETDDGQYSVKLDVYEAWMFVDKANKEPTQEARWLKIRNWLAEKLGCEVDLIPIGTAVMFNDGIQAAGLKVQGEMGKRVKEIASLPQSILESPEGSLSGQPS